MGLQHGGGGHPGLSRTQVYSVNSTDAKGQDMNATAMDIVVAAFGAPAAG